MSEHEKDADPQHGPLAGFVDALTAERVLKFVVAVVVAAAIAIVAAHLFYLSKFGTSFSDKQEVRGQFGDFVGGTINPVLSFLTLVALALTVVLQTKQLQASREVQRETAELTRAAARLAALSAALPQARYLREEMETVIRRLNSSGIKPNLEYFEKRDAMSHLEDDMAKALVMLGDEVLRRHVIIT